MEEQVEWDIDANLPMYTRDYLKMQKEQSDFRTELSALINKHSLEGGSDTPDFILAGFLSNILTDWNHAIRAREEWNNG